MILKSLEMQGFKSFPDKIKIEFGNGITAIVGPNGSGKSNISDAIRWVLGEQSNKTLRSSKMEDVIFTGTTQRRPQGFAEVSLTIDNSDRELDIDYNEVTVTRRYYRSGESEYYINKTQTRLKDINELFMDTGIGRDGYSIIGQGKIAEILSPRSEDRRQVIEEVAGISKYRYRKNEAQRKLDATEDNLLRLNDIVGELTERLPSLESQSNKAKKYLVMYDEKKSLEISLWVAEIERIRQSSHELEDKYNIAKSGLDDMTVEIDNLENEINSIFEANRGINVEIEQVRTAMSGFEEKNSQINSRIAVLEAGVRFECDNIEKIESEIKSTAERADAIRAKIDEREGIIGQKTERINAIENEVSALYITAEEISRGGSGVRREISDMREKKTRLSDNKNTLSLKKISLDTSVNSRAARLEAIEAELNTRRETAKAVSDETELLTADMLEKKQKKSASENSVSGYKKMLEIKQKRYDEARSEQEALAAKRQSTEQNLKILSDMEKHLEGFAGSVKSVLENSRHGSLSGILGTVSQLIRVDDKYITAIETALGNTIQNIVTADAKCAKNAMLLLKNNRAGRATFLPLADINPRPADKSEISGKGVIGLAHELVEASDSAGEKAVCFLLGRTVVCETIDDAIAASKRCHAKYKTVTLDGQVVNAGGSMTGGSTAKSTGLLSRQSEIERLEKLLGEQSSQLEALNGAFIKSETERNELSARLDGVMSEIRVLDEEIARIDGLIESKNVVLSSYNELIENDEREKSELYGATENEKRQSAELDSEIEALDAELEKADSLLATLEGKTETEIRRIDEIKVQISEKDIEKMSIFKDIESEKSMIEQLKTQLSAFGDESRDREQQIEQSRRSIAENEAETDRLNAELSALAKLQDDGKSRINELIEKRNASEAEQTRFRAGQRDRMAAKEHLLQEVTRLENRLANVSEQTDRAVENLMEYELTVTEAVKLAQPVENMTNARKRVSELKNSIRALGNVNVEAIEEYNSVKERYDFLDGQMTDLRNAKTELEKIIKELLWRMTSIFTEKFNLLNTEFSKSFNELFDGGKAELILLDPDDVLNCGIDIRVAPPGKIIKNIVSLSGGEQSFTAIALYFAILRVRPTPFCMVDEIEAALDDVNVIKFASKLRDFCDKTQFIVITHRRGTMEEADVLYGITMQEKGISKMLTIDVNEMERQLKL